MKSIGLGIMGFGAFGCVIYPMGYIPAALSFMQDMSPAGVWSILIGLVVVGGVIAYMGMKSDKAKSEKQG